MPHPPPRRGPASTTPPALPGPFPAAGQPPPSCRGRLTHGAYRIRSTRLLERNHTDFVAINLRGDWGGGKSPLRPWHFAEALKIAAPRVSTCSNDSPRGRKLTRRANGAMHR